MIKPKSNEEVELMRISALMVSDALSLVAKELKPGITSAFINKMVDEFILDNGATPSFKGYNGYPFATCISVNDAVVHGFPNDRELIDGDIVSVDIGVFKNNFHGDHAYTFAIGEIDSETQRLLRVTKESLYLAIEKCIVGNRVGDIGFTVQEYTEKKNGFGVVRELVGHGLGHKMHEEPQVPNYGRKGIGPKLIDGMVIAIEPMINLGRKEIYTESDGWTIRTVDGKVSAHFEHDVCVRPNKADILSNYAPIEAAEKKNPNLFWSY